MRRRERLRFMELMRANDSIDKLRTTIKMTPEELIVIMNIDMRVSEELEKIINDNPDLS